MLFSKVTLVGIAYALMNLEVCNQTRAFRAIKFSFDRYSFVINQNEIETCWKLMLSKNSWNVTFKNMLLILLFQKLMDLINEEKIKLPLKLMILSISKSKICCWFLKLDERHSKFKWKNWICRTMLSGGIWC